MTTQPVRAASTRPAGRRVASSRRAVVLRFFVIAILVWPTGITRVDAQGAGSPPQVLFMEHREGSSPLADCGAFQVIDEFAGEATGKLFFRAGVESQLEI